MLSWVPSVTSKVSDPAGRTWHRVTTDSVALQSGLAHLAEYMKPTKFEQILIMMMVMRMRLLMIIMITIRRTLRYQ